MDFFDYFLPALAFGDLVAFLAAFFGDFFAAFFFAAIVHILGKGAGASTFIYGCLSLTPAGEKQLRFTTLGSAE